MNSFRSRVRVVESRVRNCCTGEIEESLEFLMIETVFLFLVVLAFLASEFKSSCELVEAFIPSFVAVEFEENLFMTSNDYHQTREPDPIRAMS